VARIEQFHDAEVLGADLHRDLQQAAEIEVDVGHCREERLLDERADGLVGLAEPAGVVCIGGHAFQSVQDDLL
jgi:hypothetical protein